ncbi:MAG: hypothetical protein JWQ66_3257 [Mucilaginibacter sp.]|nr:hypothetical protein [Mucilaginibacter sp.]
MLLLFVVLTVRGQLFAQDTGVHFETNLSWQQLQEKAKSEHKYLFVDCDASWCGPCRKMDEETYPDETLGKTMNAQFISVKYQLDKTLHDEQDIKRNYADAGMLDKSYQVNSFPTFLFFNPEGKLIHRAQGFHDAKSFTTIVVAATNPNRQFYTLLEKYPTGKLTFDEQRNLAIAANSLDSVSIAKKVTFAYLQVLPPDSVYTKLNVNFLSKVSESSVDPGFAFFLHHDTEINKLMGFSYASNLVDKIIIAEDIGPQSHPDKLNWKAIRDTLTKKYNATVADRVITKAAIYRTYDKDWPVFISALIHDTETYEDPHDLKLLNRNAAMVLQNGTMKADFEKALAWSKRTVDEEPDNTDYKKTYLALLEKTKQP